MINLELKKLEKRQKISFIALLILIILSAVFSLNINFYISICFLVIGICIVYIEVLNKKMIKKLEES